MKLSVFLRFAATAAVFVILAIALPSHNDVAAQSGDKAKPAAPPEPKAKPKPKPKAKRKPGAFAHPEPVAVLGEALTLREAGHQIDFPTVAADTDGTLWLACIDHDGKQDTLRLARKNESGLDFAAAISEPGIIHQPAIAIDGSGAVWCIWGQTGEDDVVHLHARSFADGKTGEILTLAESPGSDSFADAGTDSKGRVWVTWQSMRAGEGDIFARYLDPVSDKWSAEISVATQAGGDWEPRLAFDEKGGAWIVYDSSRGNEFNLYLARVDLEGGVDTQPIAHSPRYEARASITTSADGESLWIAAERGRVRWGLDARGHQNDKGLNAQKEILFGRYDIASETFTEYPPGPAGQAGAPVNLPTIGVDAKGRPWLAYRYFARTLWRIAVTRFDPESKTWSSRKSIPESSMGQDRRTSLVSGADDSLWIGWPSDLRKNKTCLESGTYLAKLDTNIQLVAAKAPGQPKDLTNDPFAPSQATPERPAHDRHAWNFADRKFGLYWGDLHRHTDVSNCRTGFDGCIVEHFRYAYDMAKLDFLGTSDHTDIAKIYDPYEWWHNQRLADVFHSPEQFTSLYVYEREQRWPWGHRNVVFAQRGGPIVYIQRANYRNSPWQKLFPAKPGLGEIEPPELWRILHAYGEPVAVISHTGATGMGTDWGRYDKKGIDNSLENLVEIFQGARVSYEASGAPQPTAGHRPDEAYTVNGDGKHPAPPKPIDDFGKYKTGTYQSALEIGHRLGVFASSDHISQHVSYGGVYTEDFSREGIIKAFNERRTIAATDKIYVEFSCNGHPLGSIFETGEKPRLKISVDGTADLKRITLVRNEDNYQVFDQVDSHTFATEWTDESPLTDAENRYYLRVEQVDGNMAWSSPVWATMKSK